MPRPPTRATISSLKATSQAFRIANSILHPHFFPPAIPFAKPADFREDDFGTADFYRTRDQQQRWLRIALLSVFVLLAIVRIGMSLLNLK